MCYFGRLRLRIHDNCARLTGAHVNRTSVVCNLTLRIWDLSIDIEPEILFFHHAGKFGGKMQCSEIHGKEKENGCVRELYHVSLRVVHDVTTTHTPSFIQNILFNIYGFMRPADNPRNDGSCTKTNILVTINCDSSIVAE